MHIAWHNLDTKDNELRKAVCRASKKVNITWTAAICPNGGAVTPE